jgi:hypothetical protein
MKEKFKIRSFIRNQFPSFVKQDHSMFVSFVEAYYEWLDSNQEYIRSVSQLENLYDIDETLDVFVEDFQKTYLNSFPINLVLNPNTGEKYEIKKLLKNVKQFYKSKGIKNSYRFIFRLFYNSDIEVYYPKNYMLNLSDGKWITEKRIYLEPNEPNLTYSLVGKIVCQREIPFDIESNLTARARVTSSESFRRNNSRVLQLNLEEIFGSFDENKIVLDYDTGRVYGKTYSVLNDIQILDQGYGYEVGQTLSFFTDENTKKIILPTAKVNRVSPGLGENKGKVLGVEILDPGLNVNDQVCTLGEDKINQNGLTGGTGFSASLLFGALFSEREYYIGNTGLLSSNMVLQDNYKYQNYSYVIRSEVSFSRYIDTVKGLLHPAGVRILGETLIKRCISPDLETITNIPRKNIKLIGNYLPYTFLTYDNLNEWFEDKCYTSSVHDDLVICGVAGCFTGNPISSSVEFVEAVGASCTTADLPEGYDPAYWTIFPHPNVKVSRGVARIHENQLLDFYGLTAEGLGQSANGWQEWNYSDRNYGTTAQQEQWLSEILNNENDRYFASLYFRLDTEFRKFPIYSFLNDVECSYDCRYSNNCVEPFLGPRLGPPLYPEDYDPDSRNVKPTKTITPTISGEVNIRDVRSPVRNPLRSTII